MKSSNDSVYAYMRENLLSTSSFRESSLLASTHFPRKSSFLYPCPEWTLLLNLEITQVPSKLPNEDVQGNNHKTQKCQYCQEKLKLLAEMIWSSDSLLANRTVGSGQNKGKRVRRPQAGQSIYGFGAEEVLVSAVDECALPAFLSSPCKSEPEPRSHRCSP